MHNGSFEGGYSDILKRNEKKVKQQKHKIPIETVEDLNAFVHNEMILMKSSGEEYNHVGITR